jgi:hypothetical protein
MRSDHTLRAHMPRTPGAMRCDRMTYRHTPRPHAPSRPAPVHGVSPYSAVARRGRLGLLCAPRKAVALRGAIADCDARECRRRMLYGHASRTASGWGTHREAWVTRATRRGGMVRWPSRGTFVVRLPNCDARECRSRMPYGHASRTDSGWSTHREAWITRATRSGGVARSRRVEARGAGAGRGRLRTCSACESRPVTSRISRASAPVASRRSMSSGPAAVRGSSDPVLLLRR